MQVPSAEDFQWHKLPKLPPPDPKKERRRLRLLVILIFLLPIAGCGAFMIINRAPDLRVELTASDHHWFVFSQDKIVQPTTKMDAKLIDRLFSDSGQKSQTAVSELKFNKDGHGSLQEGKQIYPFTWSVQQKQQVLTLKYHTQKRADNKWSLAWFANKQKGQRYCGYNLMVYNHGASGLYLLRLK